MQCQPLGWAVELAISYLSHFEGGRVYKHSSVWESVSESGSTVLMQRLQLREPLTREMSVEGVKRQGEKGADADRYLKT